MIVICLEGCHGCGKSSLCKQMSEAGYSILDEAFLDMPDYALHPQSLLMETTWVCAWFQRILRKAAEGRAKGDDDQVFIADRSPFSAVFYAANGHLLEQVIREQMKEVQAASNIEIHTICVQVDAEVLWGRIQARLQREPERVRYNEDKREWMSKTLDFYSTFRWDMRVPNNHGSLVDVQRAVLEMVAARSKPFSAIVRKRSFDALAQLDINAAAASTPTPAGPAAGAAGGGAAQQRPSLPGLPVPTRARTSTGTATPNARADGAGAGPGPGANRPAGDSPTFIGDVDAAFDAVASSAPDKAGAGGDAAPMDCGAKAPGTPAAPALATAPPAVNA